MAGHTNILLLESNKLMSAGILSILGSHSQFKVTQITAASLASLDQSNSPQPDVIILDEELLTANMLALVQLTEHHPKLRLIVLSLNESSVNIFDKQTIHVSQLSDFMQLLDSLPGTDLPSS